MADQILTYFKILDVISRKFIQKTKLLKFEKNQKFSKKNQKIFKKNQKIFKNNFIFLKNMLGPCVCVCVVAVDETKL